MAKVFVYGPSGWGKTTSMRNLPPEHTAIINSDRKAIPLGGWKKNFVMVLNDKGIPDLQKSNYVETGDPGNALKALQVWNKRPEIHYIAIDTLTHMMSAEFMRKVMETGFTKFSKFGQDFNWILDFIRDECNKHIVVYAHNTIEFDNEGKKVNKVRSFGKLIEEKVEIPSVFTTVLVPVIKPTEQKGKNTYLFRTQTDGSDFAKSPARFSKNEKGEESFEPVLPYEMPNDIKAVFDALEKYDNEG